MSTYQLDIDGSGAEAGAQRIVKSFDQIKAAADRMEGGVSAAARKASASFAKITSSAKPVSQAAIDSLRQISSLFAGFRGPSNAAVRNTIMFLQGLQAVGRVSLGRANLRAFLEPLNGYRGPSATAGRNTAALLAALNRGSSFSAPRGLVGTLGALATYRGPSAAGARNTAALLSALSRFTPPPGLASIARAFIAMAAAADRAHASVARLRSVAAGSTTINVNTRGASQNIRQLQKDHSLLNSTILRTTTAMNALGGIFAIRTIITASNDIIRIRAQLEAATGSVQQARVQFGFLRETAERLGMEFVSLSRSYGFFLGAIRGTGLELSQARRIFEGFTVAGRALQLSTADVDGVFRALGQIMSKGKLQAEELRGQLGDRLPGAFVRFARAIGMVKPGELDDALKKGTIRGQQLEDALVKMADTMREEFTPGAIAMSKTVDAAFNRLRNSFTFAAEGLGRSGLNEGIIGIVDGLREILHSEGTANFLRALGAAFKFAGDNANLLGSILFAMATVSLTKWVVGAIAARTAAVTLGTVLGATNGVVVTFNGLMAAQAVQAMARFSAGATVATVAVTRLRVAMAVLWAFLKANVWILLATAIAGVVYWMTLASDKAQELRRAMAEVNNTTSDAINMADAYASSMMNLTGTVDELTEAYRRNTIAKMQNALAATNEADTGIHAGWESSWLGGLIKFRQQRDTVRTGPLGSGAEQLDERTMQDLRPLLYRGPNGQYRLRQYQTESQYRNFLRRGTHVIASHRGGLYGGDTQALTQVTEMIQARINNEVNAARQGNLLNRPFDAAAIATEMFGDYNRATQPPGLEGDPADKTKKKRGGGGEAKSFEQDIRRALDAFRDLHREIEASSEALEAYLSGGLDIVGVEAAASARAQVDNFRDSFSTVAKANEGMLELAQRLQEQGDIAPGVDISSWQAAEQAIVAVSTALYEQNLRRENDAKVGRTVADLRNENDARQRFIEIVGQGELVQQDANVQLEIEKALIGTTASERNRLSAALRQQIRIREELNRAEQSAQAIREAQAASQIAQAMAQHLQLGANEQELDYYRQMYEKREELLQQGYFGEELQGRINLHGAMLAEQEIYRRLQVEMEKLNELSRDQADAVVGAFRQGVLEGRNFLDVMKNIFKQLKEIILDAVLFNPLREFLTDAFSVQNRANAGSRVSNLRNTLFEAGDRTRTDYNFATLATNTRENIESYGGIQQAASLAQAQTTQIVTSVNSAATQIVSAIGSQTAAITGSQAAAHATAAGDTAGALAAAGSKPTAVVAGGVGGPYEEPDIIVTGSKDTRRTDTTIPSPPPRQRNFFDQFKAIFDFKANGAALKNFGKSLGGLAKGTAGAAKSLSTAVGPALQAAGNAFAAYSIGSGVGKMLGLGRVGSSVLGGAAAGYSLGGPLGAAIGAAAGLAKGLLFKPKKASQWSSVTVDAGGFAMAGAGSKYGSGDAKAAGAAGRAAANMFNQFAIEFGGNLKPGSFGTFGSKDFKGDKSKEKVAFYSALGVNKKGTPIGREGVDWIRGTESEVQAFALLKQIRGGQITGLSRTTTTIAQNTRSKTMEELQADFAVGEAYDQFLEGSFRLADMAKQVRDLNQAWKKLNAQAKNLGLSEDALLKARDRMIKQLREDFNFSIKQGILGFENPALAAYNEVEKEYREAVENAMAVGGDLVAVEKYYGLKRNQVLKEAMESGIGAIRKTASDMLNELTATTNSPLNAGTVFRNAQSTFRGLKGQLLAGDYTNVEQLGSYAQAYLDTARQVSASSTDYFDVFREVTEFLQTMSSINDTTAGGGTAGEIPNLPSIDAIVAEITAKNDELKAVTGEVGTAVLETGANTVDAINGLGGLLSDLLTRLGGNGPGSSGALPSTGGSSGVTDTGTYSGGSGGVRTIKETVNLV